MLANLCQQEANESRVSAGSHLNSNDQSAILDLFHDHNGHSMKDKQNQHGTILQVGVAICVMPLAWQPIILNKEMPISVCFWKHSVSPHLNLSQTHILLSSSLFFWFHVPLWCLYTHVPHLSVFLQIHEGLHDLVSEQQAAHHVEAIERCWVWPSQTSHCSATLESISIISYIKK